MYNIESYNYDLPQGLIAQVPSEERDHSRLLLVDRINGALRDHHFFDLPTLLRSGDLLVVNNTRVVPARLFGRKESGGRVEILVQAQHDADEEDSAVRLCLVKSSKRPKVGSRFLFDSGVSGDVIGILDNGTVRVRFRGNRAIDSLLEAQGCMPLPPYIKRAKENTHAQLDRERYQTVYSKISGAVAAPTAGLHFTPDLIGKLNQAGIQVAQLTLHVGYGTFQPVRTRDIREHALGKEYYRITSETAEKIKRVRENGGRVVAVGTTVVRALETAAGPEGSIMCGEGATGLLITPGFSFSVVDALITNFHLPRSSLLFLVSAFAGLELIRAAYNSAIDKGYRFYSYGDAMLII